MRSVTRSAFFQKKITFDAFVTHAYLPRARLRKRSWQVDERIARRHLSPVFGALPLATMTRGQVEGWLAGLRGKGYAPATCNRMLAVLKAVCALAELDGLVARSPCRGVAPLKTGSLRPRCLARKAAAQLMRHLSQSSAPQAIALRLLMLTGARKSEILRARWEQVDMERHVLTVPLSKSGRARCVFLSEAAMRLVQGLRREASGPWLFPGRAPGKPLSDVYHFWQGARRACGLEGVRIHDLRHTFASLLVNAGHSLYEVQRLLGHRDPRTTMRYAHLDEAGLLNAAETVSACLGGSKRGLSRGTGVPAPAGKAPLPERAGVSAKEIIEIDAPAPRPERKRQERRKKNQRRRRKNDSCTVNESRKTHKIF